MGGWVGGSSRTQDDLEITTTNLWWHCGEVAAGEVEGAGGPPLPYQVLEASSSCCGCIGVASSSSISSSSSSSTLKRGEACWWFAGHLWFGVGGWVGVGWVKCEEGG